jgi:hypothetical protein
LLDIEAENNALSSKLDQTMTHEAELRMEARNTLQCLDEVSDVGTMKTTFTTSPSSRRPRLQTIDGLETSPELAKQIKESISLLLGKLGPRSAPSGPIDPA